MSISTASLVNHQSQWRVPPTPRTEASPSVAASGNSRPEFNSAVVLPEPGAPMITYHGNSYRWRWPRRARRPATAPFAAPKRAFFSVFSAASKRAVKVASSAVAAASPGAAGATACCASSWFTTAWLARRARHAPQALCSRYSATMAAMSTRRSAVVSSGRASPTLMTGPTIQISSDSASSPSAASTQPLKTQPSSFFTSTPRLRDRRRGHQHDLDASV